tara:strand:- start:2641 stop:2820 length:180 start_codon:yes stop_codon:yes gene_type:complete
MNNIPLDGDCWRCKDNTSRWLCDDKFECYKCYRLKISGVDLEAIKPDKQKKITKWLIKK